MTSPSLKVAAAGLLVFALGLAVGQGFPHVAARAPDPEPTPAPVVEPVPVPPESRELKLDDGTSAGMRSIAGGGHAVRFVSPGHGWKVTSVRLYGSRYGTPRPPDEDFRVILCDADFKPVATFPFPYKTFARGNPKWVALDIKPTAVPKTFYVCVDFNPEQTKGVYVHHDAQSAPGSSFVGLPDDGKPSPFTKGDWMIRAVMEGP
jgi:RNA polymerase sigma-70 factor (ECF subfamily)